jgi:hypothetical protein
MNLTIAIASALLVATAPVFAQATWTDWTRATAGSPGSASGTLNGATVSYAGQVLSNSVVNGGFGSLWAPSGSFIGGTATTGPASVGDIITLNGAFTGTNTITFATPLMNPLFAIWSLGQPAFAASFTFSATPTLEAGGPNVSYGGRSITVSGNTVSGLEGNGVVQFAGTFDTISWTNTPENYYGFTIGTSGIAGPIPEPASYALMLAGLGLLLVVRRARLGSFAR